MWSASSVNETVRCYSVDWRNVSFPNVRTIFDLRRAKTDCTDCIVIIWNTKDTDTHANILLYRLRKYV